MDKLTQLQTLQSHQSDVTSCDFGPKERLATASRSVEVSFSFFENNFHFYSDHDVRLWNWKSKTKQFVEDAKSPLKHHSYGVNEVRFSPQGTMLVTGSTDGTAAIWDLAVRS